MNAVLRLFKTENALYLGILFKDRKSKKPERSIRE